MSDSDVSEDEKKLQNETKNGSASESGSSGDDSSSSSEEEADLIELKFRNYQPRDKDLTKFQLPRASLDKELRWADNVLETIRCSKTAEQDVLNVAPKKANWDLKRDLAKRLDILNKQTQEAIVVMIRMCCFCDGSISTCVGICVCEEV